MNRERIALQALKAVLMDAIVKAPPEVRGVLAERLALVAENMPEELALKAYEEMQRALR